MDIKNIKREDGKLAFQVLVDAGTFEKAVNQAYLKAKKSIAVPGFRKGEAPRMVIEGMYGEKVFYDDAVEGIALVAGVDRIFDMGRTVVNITGDASCALVVSNLQRKRAAKKADA